MAEQECRPDYAKRAEEQNEQLQVIKKFRDSLMAFIKVVRPYRDEKNGLAQLLGTVLIDIMEREKELELTLELAEKYGDRYNQP